MLVVTATAAGALVGFASAIALSWVPTSFETVSSIIIVGALVDLVRLSFGRPKPAALNSQVPMEWGKIFAPTVVAVLYGARLGVGPLTMLSTWLWWSAWLAASTMSPMAGALTGATFGLARILAMVATLPYAQGRGEGGVGARLRAISRPSWLALDVGAMVGVAVLALIAVGCSRTGEVTLEPVDAEQTGVEQTDNVTETTRVEVEDGVTDPVGDESVTAEATVETTPATVEPGEILPPEAADEVAGVASTPEGLASVVIGEVQWFTRLDGPGADEFLDIEAASNRQPDPSEELPLLETRRFQGGWTRAFRNDTQDVVIAQVYEFETPSAAAFYLEDGLITLGGYGVDFFDLESMEGVRGFKQDSVDDVGPVVSFGLTFTVGRRWYLLTLTGDPATATLDILVGAVQDQLELAQ